jgi:cell division protein FtsB
VKEQQAIIETQQKQYSRLEAEVENLTTENRKLKIQMEALLKSLCTLNPAAEICKEER